MDRVIVRPGAYHDSITLMRVSRALGGRASVDAAAVVMGTPLNIALVAEQGFDLSAAAGAGPNDLLIAVRASDAAALEDALSAIDGELASRGGDGARADAADGTPPRSLRSAARRQPELSLAIVSVPGPHAAYEVADALEAGLNVLCFSDGVPVEQEAALKRRALERDLLLMGPDCGTAIIDGFGLGFANAVRRGPVGIVGASGTGIQEVTSLLDAAGVGISHAIGVGGRDLSSAVGGAMTRRGIELLAADDGTEAIVVISKPPAPLVAQAIATAAEEAGKPAVLALLGARARPDSTMVAYASTLHDAAARAAQLVGARLPAFDDALARPPSAGFIRGLYCGGTLCREAMTIAAEALEPIASNIAADGESSLDDLRHPSGHAFVDLGDDGLTEGRAHPMIDPSLRLERLAEQAADRSVAAVLLDVVLGYGAHSDPAAELAPVIEAALATRDDLHVVVALCGAADDPQGLAAQRDRLEAAGAVVTRSNAHAARLALAAVGAGVASRG